MTISLADGITLPIGTANASAGGVTGILPVGNGGTGISNQSNVSITVGGNAPLRFNVLGGGANLNLPATGNVTILEATNTGNFVITGNITAATIAGAVVATQAQQEAAAAANVVVTPLFQPFHPLHPKAWGLINPNGTLAAGYGISAVADTGTGVATVSLNTPLSSTSFAPVAGAISANPRMTTATISSANTVVLNCFNEIGVAADPTQYTLVVLGDQ